MPNPWEIQRWTGQSAPPLRPLIPFGPPALLPHPRSVGPVALPWLGACSAAPFDMRQQALAQILPRFPLQHLTTPYDFNNIINPWVRTNPEVVPSLWNALQQDGLRRAFHLVLGAVAASSGLNAVDDFCQRLLAELDIALREDTRYSISQSSLSVSWHSQHLFRAFAEISHSCHSQLLGDVLRDFFQTHIRHLAEYDSPRCLAQWCHSIMRSFMATEDKDLCFITLLEHRPDLIDELELEPGPRSRRVKDYLIHLAVEDGLPVMTTRSSRSGYPNDNDYASRDDWNGFGRCTDDEDCIAESQNRRDFHRNEAERLNDKIARFGTASSGRRRGRSLDPWDDSGHRGFGFPQGRPQWRDRSLPPHSGFRSRLRSWGWSPGWPW
ncbi:hypothetical protein B0A48_07807 [Cryoendolithus antarcticus]|uniref:Uncharacterized protein n=1 Tax=Cryoendolithus antarcticus TaxID=1507870 RepID=A0A1V8T762_9PEZI|nr:hypothetical protein B0A48_07807 [Cryoendolithus antarcticus]